jgi:hypothetical protein
MMSLPHISVSLSQVPESKVSCSVDSRSGPTALPPRSPDLNPLDFCCWGHLKLVYLSERMMWKLSEIQLWQVFRQFARRQEYEIVFRRQWDVELRPVFMQEVDVWNIYCKIVVL